MRLQLVRIEQDIASIEETKDLSKISLDQLKRSIQRYYGRKTSLSAAFQGGLMADYYHIQNSESPEKVLYNYWEINGDSGTVFHADSILETGVFMIQFGFDAEGGNEQDKLASDLSHAARLEASDSIVIKNELGLIVDFRDPSFIPQDNVSWKKLLKRGHFDESFIRKFNEQFDEDCWNILIRKTSLNSSVIEQFVSKMNWSLLCWHQQLPESLILKFKDKIDWQIVCQKQSLSESFIRANQDLVQWNEILLNQKLSDEFILEFRQKFNFKFARLSSLTLIESLIDQELNWNYITFSMELPEGFIRDHFGKFDMTCWQNISLRQKLSTPFLNDFGSKIIWSFFSQNPHITDDQLREFRSKIDWNMLSISGRGLSEDLLKEFEPDIFLQKPKYTWPNIFTDKSRFPISEIFKREIISKLEQK